MPRIRSLKPSFWTDARVCTLTRDQRLLLVGLISLADDEGRFVASPAAVAGYVFPQDQLPLRTVGRWIEVIGKSEIVDIYQLDGMTYGQFRNWSKHQRINRSTPSVYPPPPGHWTEP